jgi:hypothetical protein
MQSKMVAGELKMMNYSKIIEQLISEFDLNSDTGRKKAYEKCMEYADCNLDNTSDYNPFLDIAADRLEQDPVRKDIARRLVKQSGDEKLYLIYSKESGPELTGNAPGLSYLSEVIKNLSKAKMNGEHSHFYYHEPPLQGNSYPLTIYLEDDDWFAKHARDDAIGDESDSIKNKFREIDVKKINAFLLCGKVPVELMMTPNKIYKVSACEQYENQDVWVKKIKEETNRTFVFEFKRNDGELGALALDLDDETVIFLMEDDLKQVV